MAQLALHHVNLIVIDLSRSLAFYQNLFGLTIIERPPLKVAVDWLACGALQIHLTLYPPAVATPRRKKSERERRHE
jgi:catechol 2,3-dioxygenase-like lactoylglutathione lyase family enzyme